MRASQDLSRISTRFDDPNLVSHAGLLAAVSLAQALGLADLVDTHLTMSGPGSANRGLKTLSVVGAMLAGGDSIEDVDVLRAGGNEALLGAVRAPSPIGTWLRRFDGGSVRQLDKVARLMLVRAWAAGAGPAEKSAPATLDVDSSICQVYGPAKHGATFGYTKVRGYHPLLATLAETGEVLHTRLRGGNAGTARGAGTFLAETFSRVRDAGVTGQLTLRADSGFYSRNVTAACRTAGVLFSITVRQNPSIAAAIAAIDDGAWTPIPYWSSTAEASAADVAETGYTAFAGTREEVTARLVVRRTRPTEGSQLALLVDWSYHAFLTDRAGELIAVEADHRRHAVVEQTIAALKDGGLAHLPSGRFGANSAWLILAALAHNLSRALGILAGHGFTTATPATVRRCLTAIPGRLAYRARRRHLHLPAHWPWRAAFDHALDAIRALPAPG